MLFELEIRSTFQRFLQLEASERRVVFSIISDLHTILEDQDTAEPGLRNTLPVIKALHQADELFQFDFFADLGDTGLELPPNEGRSARERLLKHYAAYHRETRKPTLVCMGNHDYDHNEYTPAEFGDLMNRPNLDCGHIIKFGNNASYGYLDLASKRVRVFFLNTGCGNPYAIADEELDFLEENLQLSGDWQALILTHASTHKNGHTVKSTFTLPQSFCRFNEIISASPCAAGVFCGDSHFDNEFRIGKVPGFITQGYGGATGKNMPPGGRLCRFDSAETMLAEVVVFYPEKQSFNVLRIGVKDAQGDRSAMIRE